MQARLFSNITTSTPTHLKLQLLKQMGQARTLFKYMYHYNAINDSKQRCRETQDVYYTLAAKS